MKTKKNVQLFILSVIFVPACYGLNVAYTSYAAVDPNSLLAQLPPLQKVHYSFAIRYDMLPATPQTDTMLYEVARITHALSVNGLWTDQNEIDKCVYTCNEINKTQPSIPASIGVNYSPWHQKFGASLPPTDRGPTYTAELTYFQQRLTLVKLWISMANTKYGSKVAATAILLTCERFHTQPGNTTWNKAIKANNDAITKIAQNLFPAARIEWYGRGVGGYDGQQSDYFTGNELGSGLSCSLYIVPELDMIRKTFTLTAALADHLHFNDVTPWVALGSGYRRGLKVVFIWCDNWSYDLIYSWQIGAEVNNAWYSQYPDMYAPYNRAKIVVFFPPPLYPNTPYWISHFIAYVRGAAGIEDLSDLGWYEPN